MCDKRFAERNAEVVCNQLGFDTLNVYLDFDQRIEYDALSLTRIIYWVGRWGNYSSILKYLKTQFFASRSRCSALEERTGCRTAPCV